MWQQSPSATLFINNRPLLSQEIRHYKMPTMCIRRGTHTSNKQWLLLHNYKLERARMWLMKQHRYRWRNGSAPDQTQSNNITNNRWSNNRKS